MIACPLRDSRLGLRPMWLYQRSALISGEAVPTAGRSGALGTAAAHRARPARLIERVNLEFMFIRS
jgi:hypothetical protein